MWSHPHRHLQDRRDPRKESNDDVTPEALFLLVLSLSCSFYLPLDL
jgi:hypothetical protein